MGLFSKENQWMKLMNRQLVAEALQIMRAELMTKNGMERHALLYAYANTLYTYTGQGPEARDAFRDLLSLQKSLRELPRNSELIMWTIHNNAQLSCSYEEYFSYVDMMRSSFPYAPLLTAQTPEIAAKRETGIPWNEVQMNMALSHAQNTGLSRPTTMYSCMACLYSIILKDSMEIPDKSKKELEFLSDIASLYTESVGNLAKAFRMTGDARSMQPTVDYICGGAAALLSQFTARQPAASGLHVCIDNIELARRGGEIPSRYDRYKSGMQSGLLDQIDNYTQKALYLEAEKGYDRAAAEMTEPIFRMLAAHNRSIFYWTYIGHGSTAFEMMEKEWQLWETLHIPAEYIPAARVFAGETAENAMLLCPDIESFVKWRERLRSVDPKAKIIDEIGKTFEEKYEDGCAWWDCMSQIAMSMYNRSDPSLDNGRYGNAAASWQMILENRKKLHLPAEGWKVAATEYGILALRLVAQNARRLGPSYNASQGAMPVQVARPFIEEYAAAHPGDEVETSILKDMKMVLSEAGAL